MSIELKMPALSPTMEEGTLAKWLVKEGDTVASGDILAEIETDKATMEFEAVDEGTIAKILVPEGSDGVKVGTPIAILAGEGEERRARPPPRPRRRPKPRRRPRSKSRRSRPHRRPRAAAKRRPHRRQPAAPAPKADTRRSDQGLAAGPPPGRGAGHRPVDAEGQRPGRADRSRRPWHGRRRRHGRARDTQPPLLAAAPPAAAQVEPFDIPHEAIKLSNMRKTIARRLTESKQQIPHIYLTLDTNLDALLKLRGELNAGLASRGVKLSVNDMLIKALALALIEVPECNVSFAGDQLIKYSRADISVAVSIPGGLITPIIADADNKAISAISKEMPDLAARAKEGKLQPHEYQGGTASLSATWACSGSSISRR